MTSFALSPHEATGQSVSRYRAKAPTPDREGDAARDARGIRCARARNHVPARAIGFRGGLDERRRIHSTRSWFETTDSWSVNILCIRISAPQAPRLPVHAASGAPVADGVTWFTSSIEKRSASPVELGRLSVGLKSHRPPADKLSAGVGFSFTPPITVETLVSGPRLPHNGLEVPLSLRFGQT